MSKEEIIKRWEQGHKQVQIAKELGVSTPYVSQVITKVKLTKQMLTNKLTNVNLTSDDIQPDVLEKLINLTNIKLISEEQLNKSIADLKIKFNDVVKTIYTKIDSIKEELQEQAEIQLKKAIQYHTNNTLNKLVEQQTKQVIYKLKENGELNE